VLVASLALPVPFADLVKRTREPGYRNNVAFGDCRASATCRMGFRAIGGDGSFIGPDKTKTGRLGETSRQICRRLDRSDE
jgi:hypothetical protein